MPLRSGACRAIRLRLRTAIVGGTALLLAWGLTPAASAQQVIVQQPVVQRFGVDTVVSVPDRGSMFLGGMGRSGSRRLSTGPLRAGTNSGSFASGSSISAGVFIHDFAAMDAALLNEAPVPRPLPDDRISRAYRRLGGVETATSGHAPVPSAGRLRQAGRSPVFYPR